MDTFDSIDLLFQHKTNWPIRLICILKAGLRCDKSIKRSCKQGENV